MDTISKDHRSWNMSRIRSSNTKIEVEVRSWLFKEGFRFRKNDKRYPGKPDVVLPKYKTVIFTYDSYKTKNCIELKGDKWKKDKRNIVRPNLTDKIPNSPYRQFEKA